uniref:hypothetical protein n=1 Tax=Neorhizobium sp. EC2-8 TaxID=3129230 RepID=UPI003101AD82
MRLRFLAALVAALPGFALSGLVWSTGARAAPTSYPLTIENCGAPIRIEKPRKEPLASARTAPKSC